MPGDAISPSQPPGVPGYLRIPSLWDEGTRGFLGLKDGRSWSLPFPDVLSLMPGPSLCAGLMQKPLAPAAGGLERPGEDVPLVRRKTKSSVCQRRPHADCYRPPGGRGLLWPRFTPIKGGAKPRTVEEAHRRRQGLRCSSSRGTQLPPHSLARGASDKAPG